MYLTFIYILLSTEIQSLENRSRWEEVDLWEAPGAGRISVLCHINHNWLLDWHFSILEQGIVAALTSSCTIYKSISQVQSVKSFGIIFSILPSSWQVSQQLSHWMWLLDASLPGVLSPVGEWLSRAEAMLGTEVKLYGKNDEVGVYISILKYVFYLHYVVDNACLCSCI